MPDVRIIFIGTPEFAVPSLDILVKNKIEVAAVITAPDKPRGRGRQPSYSPVKEYALEHGLPLLQPENLKDESFIHQLKSLNANLQIVVAFRMLPEVVWAMPSLGTFNLHASLLPKYRGAAPINWAIINGEKETGITTFFLKHQIDTGDIAFQEREPIQEEDTCGTLYDRLMVKGAELVLKTVRAIEKGSIPTLRQDWTPDLPLAPKIFKDTCCINWEQPAEKIKDLVRGLAPYPSAWTRVNGSLFKICQVSIDRTSTGLQPGELKTDGSGYLQIGSLDYAVVIEELQAEGKKKMKISDYLRGNKI